MRRASVTLIAVLLLTALAVPAEAQTYRRAAYLLCWNGGSFGGDVGGTIVESIMVDIFIRNLSRSYDKLHYCKGKQCTRARVFKDLEDLQNDYEAVDFFLATHGIKDPTPRISVEPNYSSITGQDFLAKKQTWHRRHRLRAVMGMHCDGASMLPAWTGLGFDVGMGSRQINMAGWAYVPLFSRLFRQRRCLFGGDCSRTFGQAMDLAWRLTRWMDPVEKALNTITGGAMAQGMPNSRLDSTPVYAGDTDVRITTYRGVYNACNGKGDAHAFITPKDSCCLPGQTCDGFTYSCRGFRSNTASDTISADLCTTVGPGGFSPDSECTTGSDCSSGLCLVDEGGARCARTCSGQLGCYLGEVCAPAMDADGRQRGSYCARFLTKVERACICKSLKAATCGLGADVTNPTCNTEVGPQSMQPDAVKKDLTMRYALQRQTDWMAACGCEISPSVAEKMCCTPPMPQEQGCSVAGSGGAGWLALALLGLVVLQRRRRAPGPKT